MRSGRPWMMASGEMAPVLIGFTAGEIFKIIFASTSGLAKRVSVCGTAVERRVIGQRSTHYCPFANLRIN